MLPIELRGARIHNLKGVDLTLRAGEVVCLTGPSGTGKSSLALETLHSEGQRRFVESFSPYARQFLERRDRPPVDKLDPIAASVAVDRRAPVKSSRSTVATMADLEPYLAALFSRESTPICPKCNVPALRRTARTAATHLIDSYGGQRVALGFPVAPTSIEAYLDVRQALVKDGFSRVSTGRAPVLLDELKPSAALKGKRPILVLVDRLEPRARDEARIREALEVAWQHGRGDCRVIDLNGKQLATLREGLSCPSCGIVMEPASPALFSYNSPVGACPDCRGFGRVIEVDWDKVIPDDRRSLADGAIAPWTGKSTTWERRVLKKFAEREHIPMNVPWAELSPVQRERVFDGDGQWRGGKYPGLRTWFKWLESKAYKMHVRVFLSRYREYTPCPACNGARLVPRALSFHVDGLDIAAWHRLTAEDAHARVTKLTTHDPQGTRACAELEARLGYLVDVGLGYLTLDRQARTLSGGEAQRTGLTTALGASLTETLFVVDEPTVGLHALDVPPLANAIRRLATSGNAVVVVEHEASIVRSADRIVELGPAPGSRGGEILFDGPPAALTKRLDLPTGRALAARTRIQTTARKRKSTGAVVLSKIDAHNLDIPRVKIPLGMVVALTGPSGSGKSTLAVDVLHRACARALGQGGPRAVGLGKIDGLDAITHVELVDQAPLGRTARGNAGTYTKAWDRIRQRFAQEAESLVRGFAPSHFSFNVGGDPSRSGRCEACAGEGYETVEMQFLADVSFRCEVCKGRRFRDDVLAVHHAGLSIADVLELTVDDVLERLSPEGTPDAHLERALGPVRAVGLGYLPLGQPLSTLSGGEAQRLKLARALARVTPSTLFIVDEPSAGLHAEDTRFVVDALSKLVDEGASVVVIEHDLDVVSQADHVIDLGPGGGPHGGRVVAEGPPATIATKATATGRALGSRATSAGANGSTRRSPEPKASTTPGAIHVAGAREHNLKSITCDVPHGRLSVVTGPSGSGKSSLAFDVIFAEGQRRFLETLSPYARQFLPTLPRPHVDTVAGVPPSIALEQRLARAGANSTVATVTEIAHYLRLLFAKVGTPHCPNCDVPINVASVDDVERALKTHFGSTRVKVLSVAMADRKGTHLDVFSGAARAGMTAARVDGRWCAVDPPPKLAKTKEHTIELVAAEGVARSLDRELVAKALAFGRGTIVVVPGDANSSKPERVLSTARACPDCGLGIPDLDPRWFSFNTNQGRCPTCEGRGEVDVSGTGDRFEVCKACKGARLAPIPDRVRLGGHRYAEFTGQSVRRALESARSLSFTRRDAEIAEAPHAELLRRLATVVDMGLDYLSLDRAALTLSGGEMQRLRLCAQIGSGLTGALYVLDEPTIGLHPRDTHRLIEALRKIVGCGSTVVVVEHDTQTIEAADHVIDMGPAGGPGGGEIVASGSPRALLTDPSSPTGSALAARRVIVPPERPKPSAWIEITDVREHNLDRVRLRFPTERLTVVAGVSGSGKSTLVRSVVLPAVREALGLVTPPPGAFGKLVGAKAVSRALAVDQSPIGRTPRSVPATFLGIWDDIRRLYASIPEAKLRGYAPTRFSFNSPKGGRCPACEGQGSIVAEMAFLPDVTTPCETCGGMRFEPGTLEIRYRDRSIGEVLKLSISEAREVFAAHPRILRPLGIIDELGLGYLSLGQPSNTLSGGEAQRLKLAAELAPGATSRKSLYVLDEPTTGLHISDVAKLVAVLERLVDRGDTLVVIEHHLDVIRAADWVVELGPDGGDRGGKIVFSGPPGELAKAKTATGESLRDERVPGRRRPKRAARNRSSTKQPSP